MKLFLLIFSFLFLVSAVNDCCLVELEEELTKTTKITHFDDEHSEDSDNCEDCKCSAFCSYSIITTVSYVTISTPSSSHQRLVFFIQPTKEKSIPNSIFHPPIV